MAQSSTIQKRRLADASVAVAHPAAVEQRNAASDLLRGTMIVSAFAALLATAGCGASPPVMSGWPGQDWAGIMASRGDPYARAALTPAQWQRANTYQPSRPVNVPSAPPWGQDTTNLAMGAGAGYLLGRTTSGAEASAPVTTGAATGGAATIAPEVVTPEVATPQVVAPAIESAVTGEELGAVVTTDVAPEIIEGWGVLELLEDACLLVCW
jgi:hypothetical protein